MSKRVLDLIERKRTEARTVARLCAELNPTRALENFNQIKGKNFHLSTYRRRHGLDRADGERRGVTLEEFTTDFFTDGFASRTAAQLVTNFSVGLIRGIENESLPPATRPQTPWEIQDEIDRLLNDYRSALMVMDEEKARSLAVKIRNLSNALVDATHMQRAFSVGVG